MPPTPEEMDFEERRKQSIWERFDAFEQECRRGHKAIRDSFRKFEDENNDALGLMRDAHNALRGRVDLLERTNPDVTKLRFSTGVMVSIVVVTASVVGAGYGFSAMVTGRIDALSKRLDDQAASAAKLTEERSAAAQRSIDALTRQMELLKYEQQRLREDVTKTKGPRS